MRCPRNHRPPVAPASPAFSPLSLLLPLALLPATLLPLSLSSCDKRENRSAAALPRYTVSVAQPVRGDVPVYREWVGRLQAQVSASLLPQIEGYVSERLFTNGQSVRKGDILYRIDPRRYEQSLEQARQQRSQAQADAVAAEQDVDYYTPLVANGAISRQQYTTALQNAKAARAALQAADAVVALAETNVAYCTLEAPVDGIMGFAAADVGSYVSPGGKALVTISQLDPLRVYFSVSEQEWLSQGGPGGPLSPGQKVEILLPSGEACKQPATLVGADNNVDTATGTVMLDAALPNSDGLLRPGMYVKVRVLVNEVRDALLVPVGAIVSIQGKPMLVQVDEQNRASLIAVQTGPEINGLVSVTGPVSTASRIVVSGTQQGMMAAEGRAQLDTVSTAIPPANATGNASGSPASDQADDQAGN